MNDQADSKTTAGDEHDSGDLRYLGPEEMPAALRLSEKLRRFVDWIGRLGSWFILPLVLITAYDVIVRKAFGKQQIWLVARVCSTPTLEHLSGFSMNLKSFQGYLIAPIFIWAGHG